MHSSTRLMEHKNYVCMLGWGTSEYTAGIKLQISKVTHTKLRQDWRLVMKSVALVKSCSKMHYSFAPKMSYSHS